MQRLPPLFPKLVLIFYLVWSLFILDPIRFLHFKSELFFPSVKFNLTHWVVRQHGTPAPPEHKGGHFFIEMKELLLEAFAKYKTGDTLGLELMV